MKRHRMEAHNRGKESADNKATKRRSTLPIYTIVPSPDTGRLVVTLRRQGAVSSRMASPDSTVDTMGDVTNISHSRKERGGLAGRHHRLRHDGCPYGRHTERSERLDAEEGVKVSLCDGESSSSLMVKGHGLPHKVIMKKRDYFREPKAMMQGLIAAQNATCGLHGDLAQRQDETARSDLNDMQAGSSILHEAAEAKSDCLAKEVAITSTGCSSTSVEYDATIDDDDE